jgi:hypothetical protein
MDTIIGRVLALVVGALAIVGVYEAYANVMDNQHVASLQQELSVFQQNITTQYQRRPGRYAFGTLSTATAIANQLAPSSAVNSALLTNPFNGNYVVVGNNVYSGPATTFGVWADNVPVAMCVKAVETFGTGGGLNGGPIYGYGVAANASGSPTVNTTIPDTDTNANSNCSAPGGGTVAVLMVFNG